MMTPSDTHHLIGKIACNSQTVTNVPFLSMSPSGTSSRHESTSCHHKIRDLNKHFPPLCTPWQAPRRTSFRRDDHGWTVQPVSLDLLIIMEHVDPTQEKGWNKNRSPTEMFVRGIISCFRTQLSTRALLRRASTCVCVCVLLCRGQQ